MHRRLALALGALLIAAGCGSSTPATPSAASAVPASASAAPASAAPSAVPPSPVPPSGAPSRAPASDDLQPLLPTSVGGHTLVVTQFTGSDFTNNPGSVSQELVDLLAALDRGPGDLTLASASDPSGGTDLNITAFKVRDVPVQTFLDKYLPLLRSSAAGATVSQATRAGKSVWSVTGQLGRPPQVLLVSGDVLYVVSSTNDSLVDAALTALH
jgi:hypothetical protein